MGVVARKPSRRKGTPEELEPWLRTIRPADWKNITGKGPERDHLLLVWREAEDRNLMFLVPRERIPDAWGPDLHQIDDLYLDLENEEGNDDDVTRLLGLIYCAINTVAKLNSITYREVSWPISAITGMWGKYLISGEDLDRSRVGLVICAGSVAPPGEDS
jgi:hypothetical protein